MDTDIDKKLLDSIERDLPCEIIGHHIDKDIHDDGPGVWYVLSQCPDCGIQDIELMCDWFYLWCVSQWRKTTAPCQHCGHRALLEDFWLRAVERT